MQNISRKLPYVIPALTALIYRLVLPATLVDDAYITMQTARNIALGNGMVFNAGERIFTVTAPLWVFLNAAVRAFGVDSVIVVFVLGLIFEIILSILVVSLGKGLLKNAWGGGFASILLITNPVFSITSLGGMEIALSICAIALSFLMLEKKRPNWALTVAAVGVWIRFDNLILLVVAALWVIFNKDLKKKFACFIPAIVLISAYLALAQIYFGSPIPVSILRKALFPGGESWGISVLLIAREFFYTIVGKNTAYGFGYSPLIIILPFVIGGIILTIKRKGQSVLPLLSFSLTYFLAYVLTGKDYALFFPWYFVPLLLGVYVLAGFGIIGLTKKLLKKPRVVSRAAGGLCVLWALVMLVQGYNRAVDFRYAVSSGREQTYAAATVWLGMHLPENSTICSGEIGAIGFFARPDIRVLDMVGLTRPLDDRRLPVNLIDEENVEAIIYWRFPGQEFGDISEVYPKYEWGEIGEVMIGFRDDLAPGLLEKSDEIPIIMKSIDMGREFRWTYVAAD
ncbi:hypothetical protein DRQ36_07195 [bacterium]|nr:MAG: hypothetical protein DRQ36_07195 [bacterium]